MGPDCRTAELGGSVADGALDVYGALLTADYELAVIGVAAVAANSSEPEFQEGPYGLTLFGSLCPTLPATDTVTERDDEDRAFWSVPLVASVIVFVIGVVIVTSRRFDDRG